MVSTSSLWGGLVNYWTLNKEYFWFLSDRFHQRSLEFSEFSISSSSSSFHSFSCWPETFKFPRLAAYLLEKRWFHSPSTRNPSNHPQTSFWFKDLLFSYEKASSARIPSCADLRLSTGPPGNHGDSECGWLRSAVISVTWTIKHPSRNPFLRRFSKNIMT